MTSPDRRTRRQQRTWRRQATRYDEQIGRAESGVIGTARRWIGERASGRTLEVAVGSGRSIPFYRDDVELTGIDLSPEMLAIADTRVAGRAHPVDLMIGDAEALPFDDAEFDTVVCALALCSIPRPALAIAEMKRVLRPGGTLLLADHVRSTWPPVTAVLWIAELFTVPVQGEHLTRRHLATVRSAGLSVVEHERRSFGMVETIRALNTPSPPDAGPGATVERGPTR
ncbi:MAG: class I SAM-dependent methyltransferase [Leifsonia sp.]|uniref:class I SAM-dependent methyltransferase n=1 Tax=Leifsonia sp. TaxID=1870902 RepID=UPI003F7F595E